MHFIEFKFQPLSMQAYLICQHGIYLSERAEGDYFVALYALFDFYVEVYYRFKDSEVVIITSFHNTNLLEPYLKKISLSEIKQQLALYQ